MLIFDPLFKANILVDENENPLLCDFGLSRMLELSEKSLWKTSADRALGTYRWMAPELIKGSQPTVTLASDVYAFAMTSYVSPE